MKDVGDKWTNGKISYSIEPLLLASAKAMNGLPIVADILAATPFYQIEICIER